MKLAELQLLAFGPFTGRTVVFGEGPATLHIVHGPNEAGKSSALRAMGDLRFGIPLRTTDNFVHPHEQLLIGGVFVDADGQRVELRRSKSRARPLVYVGGDQPVSPAHEAQLTGGVSRADFEAMFGIDHERLRAGGRQLLRGDGELGAALFEASAGARGIKALLASLEVDARQLWNPRGNARVAVMNEAARQFDEARREWRDAQVRPADWQQRKRTHDEAQAEAAEVSQALDAQRRQLAQWSELRAVAPLLRQLDASAAELAELAATPLLDEGARDERVVAEPALWREQAALREARGLVARCDEELAGLQVDDAVLVHAGAMERLIAQREGAVRSRADAARQQGTIDRLDGELRLSARRIAGKDASPADALAAVPSTAEGQALERRLGHIENLAAQLRMLRQQAQEATEQLQAATEARVEAFPDAGLRAAVQEALARAHALGDVEQRLRESNRQRRELSLQVEQLVHDLEAAQAIQATQAKEAKEAAWASQADRAVGEEARAEAAGSSAEGRHLRRAVAVMANTASAVDGLAERLRVYRQARPLLSAEIESERAAQARRDERVRQIVLDLQALERDLAEQQRRLGSVAAEGEVVTAEMLRETRQRRDGVWREVCDALTAGASPPPAMPPLQLAHGFEAMQSEADRQADVLRADAQRAAVYEECRLRIEQMSARRAELQRMGGMLDDESATAAQAWRRRLREAGLPAQLAPAALAEWQALRAQLIERADRLAGFLADREQVLAALGQATHGLRCSLQALVLDAMAGDDGLDAVDHQTADADALLTRLRRLMRRAIEWEDDAVRLVAAQDARIEALAAQRETLARLRRSVADTEAGLGEHRAALEEWLQRAFLEPGSPPERCRARLADLRELQASWDELAAQVQRGREWRALAEEADMQAAHVAGLLGEARPSEAGFEDYVEGLRQRLGAAQEAASRRKELQRDHARGLEEMHRAEAAIARHEAVLQRLCAAAGVTAASELPAIEDASARKRRAQAAHESQRSLLAAQASTRGEPALRALLAEHDLPALDQAIAQAAQHAQALEARLAAAQAREREARSSLEEIDASDAAAQARERMEHSAARWRATAMPWARLRVAHALLQESLRSFRERAQAPMMQAASRYFALMTGGRYPRLAATDEEPPTLRAEREDGSSIPVEAMSEGTADQLYLALRLAALELRASSHPFMPLVLDDVLVTSDEQRAGWVLQALAEFSRRAQVLLFTHHRHVAELGEAVLDARTLSVHSLA